MRSDAPGLPVMLNVAGRRCVVVGGGPVAARRATTLVACGAQVVVVAPAMDETLDRLLIERRDRGYETGDLDGAFFVVIATDNPAVNQQVAADAAEEGVLINRAAPGIAPPRNAAASDHGGDVTVMGHDRRGPLTIAVDTGHSSAAAGKAIRRELNDKLDPDWVTLLEAARPWRTRVQRAVNDPAERAARLRRLTDAAAMRMLKDHGEAALQDHLRRVAENDGSGEANSGGTSGGTSGGGGEETS